MIQVFPIGLGQLMAISLRTSTTQVLALFTLFRNSMWRKKILYLAGIFCIVISALLLLLSSLLHKTVYHQYKPKNICLRKIIIFSPKMNGETCYYLLSLYLVGCEKHFYPFGMAPAPFYKGMLSSDTIKSIIVSDNEGENVSNKLIGISDYKQFPQSNIGNLISQHRNLDNYAGFGKIKSLSELKAFVNANPHWWDRQINDSVIAIDRIFAINNKDSPKNIHLIFSNKHLIRNVDK